MLGEAQITVLNWTMCLNCLVWRAETLSWGGCCRSEGCTSRQAAPGERQDALVKKQAQKSVYKFPVSPVWKLANKFSWILLEHTQGKKSLEALWISMFMHAQRKKLACSCNQRAFKDNVINYVVCLVVVPSFPSFHLERLAELETESMLVFSTRKAQEKKRSFQGRFHQVQFLLLKLTLFSTSSLFKLPRRRPLLPWVLKFSYGTTHTMRVSENGLHFQLRVALTSESAKRIPLPFD